MLSKLPISAWIIYLLLSSFLTSCASSIISNALQKFIDDAVSRCEQNQGSYS